MIIAQMIGRNESSRFLEDVLQRLSTQVDKIIFKHLKDKGLLIWIAIK